MILKPACKLAGMIRLIFRALGHHARWALPIGVLTGIAFPALASLMRPLLTLAVVATMTVTLVRLDWTKLGRRASQPGLPLLMTVLQLVLSPLIAWLLSGAFGMAAAVSIALILQCAAPPVGSAAAFALMTGIDGERVLILTVVSTVLLPLSLTPVVALLLPHSGVTVELLPFFLRVCLLVAAPFVLAAIIRRVAGAERIKRNDDVMSGINVTILVVFAIAIMDGVTRFLVNDPAQAAWLLILSFLMAVLLHLFAYLVFRWYGHENALVAALSSGNRNMGLMLAVTAGTAGEIASLYFGIAQIPMYCVPLLLTPLIGTTRARR